MGLLKKYFQNNNTYTNNKTNLFSFEEFIYYINVSKEVKTLKI